MTDSRSAAGSPARLSLLVLALALLTISAAAGGGFGLLGETDASPVEAGRSITSGAGPNGPSSVSAADFLAHVRNPCFPLRPGTTFRYRGTKDGKPTVDVYRVAHRVRRILGVPCVSVRDRLFEAGKLEERTTDWYTEDRQGRVWYFGEETAELNRAGRVTSTEGSWQAGVDGARPGIFMPPAPRVGQWFRQEYLKGEAEDHFSPLSLDASVTVPSGEYPHALLTREWTPLEPGVIDHKYYVRGIGEVSEETVKGPVETSKLVSVSRH
jgi:hypothetical protein